MCTGMFAVNKSARERTQQVKQVLLYFFFAAVNKEFLVSFKRSARFNQTEDCALKRRERKRKGAKAFAGPHRVNEMRLQVSAKSSQCVSNLESAYRHS